MKVTKEMHDPELRYFYRMGRMVTFMASRKWVIRLTQGLVMNPLKGKKLKGVHNDERHLPSSSTEGHQIRVRIFRPANATGKLPALLYLHGGGYMMGIPESALPFIQELLQRRDLVIVAPAYRLSMKHPFPAGFNDCYDTLLWMKEHADELGIHPDKFLVAGHSAGGGMTAAVTLKARDTQDVKIAFQMPVYPMMDHRQVTESANMGTLVWDKRSNHLGWEMYLGGLGSDAVPPYASPALNQDYRDFPPTISFVGALDPFRDETTHYLEALKAAGVPTRFKVFPGAFHGFETVAAKTAIGKAGNAFQLEAFEEFFDAYVGG
jgi:acetyl esterase/lipase